uniref:Uncharacterized protein n=1 Tax=Ditylenchus dipsaci TaxID=166011 RepID=A0A915D009_9BILA
MDTDARAIAIFALEKLLQMEALLAKPYAAFSNRKKKKYTYQGRMYTKHRDLKGINKGKVSAECDQRAIGCNGRAWFSEEGQFIK